MRNGLRIVERSDGSRAAIIYGRSFLLWMAAVALVFHGAVAGWWGGSWFGASFPLAVLAVALELRFRSVERRFDPLLTEFQMGRLVAENPRIGEMIYGPSRPRRPSR